MVKHLAILLAACLCSSCANPKKTRCTEAEAALVGQWKIESVTANGVIERTEQRQYEMTLMAPDRTGNRIYKERGEWSVAGNTYTMIRKFSEPFIPDKIGTVAHAELLSVKPDEILMKYPDSPVISETLIRRGQQ